MELKRCWLRGWAGGGSDRDGEHPRMRLAPWEGTFPGHCHQDALGSCPRALTVGQATPVPRDLAGLFGSPTS